MTATPTPTETARRLFDSLLCINTQFIHNNNIQKDVTAITAALTAAHAQGWDECVEACAVYLTTHIVVYDSNVKTGNGFRVEVRRGASLKSNTEGEVFAAAIRALKGGPK